MPRGCTWSGQYNLCNILNIIIYLYVQQDSIEVIFIYEILIFKLGLNSLKFYNLNTMFILPDYKPKNV